MWQGVSPSYVPPLDWLFTSGDTQPGGGSCQKVDPFGTLNTGRERTKGCGWHSIASYSRSLGSSELDLSNLAIGIW